MARYINADKLCEALKSMANVQYPDKQSTILGVVSSIENFPTADVVPKSEIAREIFEEIDEIKKQYASGDINGNELYARLYLLEKKYTEGGERYDRG